MEILKINSDMIFGLEKEWASNLKLSDPIFNFGKRSGFQFKTSDLIFDLEKEWVLKINFRFDF